MQKERLVGRVKKDFVMNKLREECASSRSNSKMEKRREPRKRSLCEQ